MRPSGGMLLQHHHQTKLNHTVAQKSKGRQHLVASLMGLVLGWQPRSIPQLHMSQHSSHRTCGKSCGCVYANLTNCGCAMWHTMRHEDVTDYWDAMSVSMQIVADAHGRCMNPTSSGFQAPLAWHICICSCAGRSDDNVPKAESTCSEHA